MEDNGLIRELKTLGLPPDDFAVFGSGPMMAHGLKEANDLDLIVRGEAWEKALTLGELTQARSGDEEVVVGNIEVFRTWSPGEWDADKLIDEAVVINGIRFVRLEEVLKWKRMVNRPKDREHIVMIERFLSSGGRN